jgi:hypothetical protein
MSQLPPELVAQITAAVLARGGRPEGTELRFQCVMAMHHANGDAHPSARWNPAKAVWHCDACGAGGGAFDLAGRLGLPRPGDFANPVTTSVGASDLRRETRWMVRNAAGTVEAVHVRVDGTGRRRKRYEWQRPDGRPGLDGRRACTLPLYGSERVASVPDAGVVLVEGEKAADALRTRGVLAVATVTGASGTPSPDVLRILADRDVVLWCDADDPGRRHMERIAAQLVALGAQPRWLEVPGKNDGDDAADYGGTDTELAALLAAAPAWSPNAKRSSEIRRAGEPVGVLLADVHPEPVAWLWPGRLARGKLTILEGRPDEGKTTLALDLAARVSTGAPMPGESERREPAGVVIVTAEDGLADTIRPRLEAAGAALNRILAPRPDEVPSLDDAGRAWLRQACTQVGAALVILDPLVALMPGAVDAHRDQDVRRMLRPLRALAEECAVAVMALRHLRKAAGSAKDAGGGSVGIGAAARVVMLAAPDPDDPERRILARVKGNLAPPWPSLAYRLVPAEGTLRLKWLGETPHTADALLAATDADEPGALDAALELVRDVLRDGPVRSSELDAAARAAGISERTLRRARTRAGVRAERSGRGWVVRLPLDQDGQGGQAVHSGRDGRLGHLDGGDHSAPEEEVAV